MKEIFIQKILKFMAWAVLKKRKPIVVAVTGSVGKTTTKEAIAHVLSGNFRVRSNLKNYNNEIGVPLTILGCQVDYSRNKIFQIFGVTLFWFKSLFFDRNYPEILVLEMGADKPGDIKYFCDFIPITVGILTEIGISHLEKFKTKQALAAEKSFLLRSIKEKGLAVYNKDNKLIREIGNKLSVNSISYGIKEESEMMATDLIYKVEVTENFQQINGTNFKLNYQGKVLPVRLNHCVGKGAVYSVLAALAVGRYFDLNVVEMIESFKNFSSCSGRMNLLKGIRGSILIDDSYNSAPNSLELALELVEEIKASRKIIILGDMLELGDDEIRSHRNVGKKMVKMKPDYFITIGKRMKEARNFYRKNSLNNDNVMSFKDSFEARDVIKELVQPGDLILIKGSRGMKMEKIVEVIKNDQ